MLLKSRAEVRIYKKHQFVFVHVALCGWPWVWCMGACLCSLTSTLPILRIAQLTELLHRWIGQEHAGRLCSSACVCLMLTVPRITCRTVITAAQVVQFEYC